MSVQFQFEQKESNASNLYLTKAVDEGGNILMQWEIACDDEAQLETIALDAYQLAINPPQDYLTAIEENS